MDPAQVIDLTGSSDTEDCVTMKHTKIKAIGDYIRHRVAGPHHAETIRVEDLTLTESSTVLCTKQTQLYLTMRDRGWACGYRNSQMLLSSLIPLPILNTVPQVIELQQMLEQAWNAGFDPDGYAQLGRVVNTRKWIGATEIYCILAHLGVRAHIVDFHRATGANGTHPALFAWIVEYFTSGSKDERGFTNKHPLYLQHQGHSRTVVGVELGEKDVCVLVFDPDVPVAQTPSRFLLSHTKHAQQYQIVYVDSEPHNAAQIPKVISSARIP
ncbi:hypothetical protein GGH96_005476 [Coemansia sp. RSA 1972]|nr:hypothetical protein GGH96_005476 [Coemansia sp. RSA 1972]